jgi:hypothetical protein
MNKYHPLDLEAFEQSVWLDYLRRLQWQISNAPLHPKKR